MDQLIQQLQDRIAALVKELESAHAEINTLKSQSHSASASSVTMVESSYDLLSQMNDLSTSDKVQLYIEDSLDLLSENHNTTILDSEPSGDAENQLSFDLAALTLEKNHPITDVQTQPTDNERIPTVTTTPSIDLFETQATEESFPLQISADNTNTQETIKTAATEEHVLLKKRQKNQKNNRKLIQLLESRYPKAFNRNNPRPLKVGIDKDIKLDDELTEGKLKRALAAYTRSERYQKCLLGNNNRINLDGTPVASNKSKKSVSHRHHNNEDKRPKQYKQAATESDELSDTLSDTERMQAKLNQLLNIHKH